MAVHDSASAQHENKLLAHLVLIPSDAEIPLLITAETRRPHRCCPQLWTPFVEQTQDLGEGPHCVPAKPTVLPCPRSPHRRSDPQCRDARRPTQPAQGWTRRRRETPAVAALSALSTLASSAPAPRACISDRDAIGRVPRAQHRCAEMVPGAVRAREQGRVAGAQRGSIGLK